MIFDLVKLRLLVTLIKSHCTRVRVGSGRPVGEEENRMVLSIEKNIK